LRRGYAVRLPNCATPPKPRRNPAVTFILMALEMKTQCERCSKPTAAATEAYICTYECTFCKECTQAMKHVCPNCGGELVQRPRRAAEPQQCAV
jgi:uncharacterized protein